MGRAGERHARGGAANQKRRRRCRGFRRRVARWGDCDMGDGVGARERARRAESRRRRHAAHVLRRARVPQEKVAQARGHGRRHGAREQHDPQTSVSSVQATDRSAAAALGESQRFVRGGSLDRLGAEQPSRARARARGVGKRPRARPRVGLRRHDASGVERDDPQGSRAARRSRRGVDARRSRRRGLRHRPSRARALERVHHGIHPAIAAPGRRGRRSAGVDY